MSSLSAQGRHRTLRSRQALQARSAFLVFPAPLFMAPHSGSLADWNQDATRWPSESSYEVTRAYIGEQALRQHLLSSTGSSCRRLSLRRERNAERELFR